MSESRFDLSRPTPLLFLGDGPDSHTGLGRIGHDLAWIASSMPQFRVGYLGRQAFGRGKFPWTQYSFSASEQWGEQRLEEAWQDLSQGQRGIIMTVWDASRLLWLADPIGIEGRLGDFLRTAKFERWGYFMQDSEGLRAGQIPMENAHTMSRFRRVCLASKWARELTVGSVEHPDVDWIPHGINRSSFQPIEKLYSRSAWGISMDATIIGCVMSNQERKSWPVVFEAVAQMNPQTRLWIHTDRMMGYWNLPALIREYNLSNQMVVEERELSDAELAMRYSGCNATVLISGGEGFGYPVAESLSCGIPCVTGGYGAQAELVPEEWRVRPIAHEVRTQHNVVRAIYDSRQVREKLEEVCRAVQSGEVVREKVAALVEHLVWPKIGRVWKRWFERGLR